MNFALARLAIGAHNRPGLPETLAMLSLLALIPLFASACAAAPAPAKLSPSETTAAFEAAGFTKAGRQWRKCDDPGSASYVPGAIEEVRDLNGDGRPEAVITESSMVCHGEAGSGFAIVSKQANGGWKLIAERTGMATFLAAKGAGGWPDMEVGGPGFCFPVERWDGAHYRLHRKQYEGKRCR